MTDSSIIFPGLGLVLSNVKNGIVISGFNIAFYGMIIAFGMVLATIFISKNAKLNGESSEDFLDITYTGIICGIIGARIYYVIFAWGLYKDNLISILNIRNGGLAIFGGIIGGAIGVFVCSRLKHINFFKAGDIVIPGVLIGQICGRWGNFFNREAFGDYCSNIFRMGIPVNAVRSTQDITDIMYKNKETIEGIDFIFVHPTFLYESIWNIAIFIICVVYARKPHKEGNVLAIYLLGYGIGRFLIERLRTDQLLIPRIGFPVSMLVSLICVALSMILFFRKRT